ncbi:MAG: hypothetical protein R2741_03735 [Methanolobus sp.]
MKMEKAETSIIPYSRNPVPSDRKLTTFEVQHRHVKKKSLIQQTRKKTRRKSSFR